MFDLLKLVDQKGPSLHGILGNGQLLLVSCAIAAGALGELVLIEMPSKLRLAKLLAIGGCVISVIVSSMWFGDISAAIQEGRPPPPASIGNGSIVVFAFTLVSAGSCIVLACIEMVPK